MIVRDKKNSQQRKKRPRDEPTYAPVESKEIGCYECLLSIDRIFVRKALDPFTIYNLPSTKQKICGGERGIRTLERLLTFTHFPGVLLQPLGHLTAELSIIAKQIALLKSRGRVTYLSKIMNTRRYCRINRGSNSLKAIGLELRYTFISIPPRRR